MPNAPFKTKLYEEAPSIALLALSYGAFIGLTLFADVLGLWIACTILIPALVLHASLQHEYIHGHPTSNQALNDFLVSPPLSIFVPYLRFKDTHLAHHYDPNLTDPYDDPESNFCDPKIWNTLSRPQKAILNFNNTILGRMAIGPLVGLACFYTSDMLLILKGDRRVLIAYGHHCVFLGLVSFWMLAFATMPFWALLVTSYLAMSVLKIRTFLEHQAHERVAARTVIIEDQGFLALLFLNNNFHSVHHTHPKLVWHKLPSKFYARKEEYLTKNDGYWFQSYWSVFRLYFFERKDPVPHPRMAGHVEPEFDNGAAVRVRSSDWVAH